MPYLEHRANLWYAVLTVPKDVQEKLDLKKFVRSTGTADKRVAQIKAYELIAIWKAEIAEARGNTNIDDALRWAESVKMELDSIKSNDEHEAVSHAISDYYSRMAYEGETKRAEALAGVALGNKTPLRLYVDQWIETLDLAEKTVDQMHRDIQLLISRYDNAEEVTPEDIRQWVKHLQTPKELNGKGYGTSSLKRIFGAARSYWSYLQDVDRVPFDYQPFVLTTKRRKEKTTKGASSNKGWKPYTPSEAVYLYQCVVERGDHSLADLMMLAMYSGARIEELCSIRVKDVSTSAFNIVDSKTDAGIRSVPVHSSIKDVVQRLLDTSVDGYLLSGLSENKYGDRSNAIGKRFGRLKIAKGFGRDHVFHSLRKTVITMLENAGISENLTADIVGHEKNTITYGLYSGGHSIEAMANALETLSYPKVKIK